MRSIFKYFGVTLFFVLLLAYTIYDYLNSGNSGFDDSSRGRVYLFLVLIAFYSLLYVFFHFPKNRHSPPFIRIMVLLLLWIILCNLVNHRLDWTMYVHLFLAIWWICSYFYFYVYCRANPNSTTYIIDFFSLMMIMYLYFSFESQTRIQMNRETEHVVLNYAYNILAFIPIILLRKNRITRYFLLFLAISAIFLSFKRGPLVILPGMYLAYHLGLIESKKGVLKQLLKLILAVIVFVITFSAVDSLSGGFLSSRFTASELQYGSTRQELWAMAIEDIADRDLFTFLIGKGSGSSIELLTSGVHNEWLEFLFSFGAIGVVLYFCFGISLVIKFSQMRKKKSIYTPVVGTLVAFFWIVGFFSGFYFVHASFYFFALLGIIDALETREMIS